MKKIISSRELSVVAAERLREMIAAKDMKPGDQFPSEAELVAMFGIARSTVREAIKLLTAENIVEIRRGKGTFITANPGMVKDPLGLNFANQKNLLKSLMETRMMIEPQIAYLAAQRAKPENLQKLRMIIEKMQEANKQNIDYTQYDVEFHTAVAECTQNDVLHRILPIICESIREGYLETVNVEGSFQRAIISHNNIYEAIKKGGAEQAKLETEKHLRQTLEDSKINGGL
ncbi:FadR/GntR family transcriptional regulator [Acetanaerobacterium elongatum]|uniref:DNA-binding transcriptional regulator, FadR family n=1 Tax=Acetanaerobacterium elongatum TaxID=258515 RepID=A0A1H0DT41_9FIRM|nr:FadR/GntR family transcriptional regulator [Acetanaerobacterium elongatum]SDN73151.1 DNA-binding transcriptional regulator, FadR family [Acetanaerobacterium elongatum]